MTDTMATLSYLVWMRILQSGKVAFKRLFGLKISRNLIVSLRGALRLRMMLSNDLCMTRGRIVSELPTFDRYLSTVRTRVIPITTAAKLLRQGCFNIHTTLEMFSECRRCL